MAIRPKGKTAHWAEPAIDQSEQRHHPAAIGFIGVNLQQRCDGGEESGLKATGDEEDR